LSHKHYRHEKNCLNCGAAVEQKFCPACGQENLEVRENFFHLAIEFAADYFHYDSKFFKSTVPLITKPGFLTKEYWEGKRVSYIHPLRLFFFITIIFMISTSFFYNRFGDEFRNSIVLSDTARVDSSYALKYKNNPEKLKSVEKWKETERRQTRKLQAGIDDFFRFLKYVTFFLLPVYALAFKILYNRTRPFYVDHLVYTLHLQSFAYLIFSVIFLIPFIVPLSAITVFQIGVLIILIYVAISLHLLHRQSWWKTILKSFLGTLSLVMLTLFTFLGYMLVDAIFVQ
jgi:hypothetical protein